MPRTDDGELHMIPAARHASTVEHATAEIRRAILDGRMAPGMVASLAMLSQELGMSAIPVREALRALEAEGLIVLRPNRRAVVAPMSVRELEDIYRTRGVYEVELAVRSAAHYSVQIVRRLEDLIDAISSESVPETRMELHSEFHELLVTPAASDFDWRLLRIIWRASERYVRFNLNASSGLELRTSHVQMLDAARNKTESGMRRALTAHLDEGLTILARELAEAAATAP